ncbi:hypothetical protein NQ317_018793 [Molorchus minor]|uniref:Tetraspanin n=1 Tax=Molorchus minor TaxID=1323400 RepID=A0ABQ9J4Z6_9CUCU|nr:hypothetical protein NQ317_018793 [Molorchus minor]
MGSILLLNFTILLQTFAQPGVLMPVSYILIAVGALMFLVSFLGYCGALRESQCMLTTNSLQNAGKICFFVFQYGILLLIILILEITAGCLAVIYKTKAEEQTKLFLKTSLAKYYTQSEEGDAFTLALNSLQTSLHCCGIDNYTDYQKNEVWARGDKVIPESCCVLDENMKPLTTSCTTSPSDVNSYYMKGCLKEVLYWMDAHLNTIIGIAIGFGLIEVLGIFLCFCLAKSLNSYNK